MKKIISLFVIASILSCTNEISTEDTTMVESSTMDRLHDFAFTVANKSKQEEPPMAINYFDWGSEALINYHYRFTKDDTTSFDFFDTTFTITAEVVKLDSASLDYYVEIPEVQAFITAMNTQIQALKPANFTPAIIDVARINIDENAGPTANYSIMALYKKPKWSYKGGINPNDPDVLVWASTCTDGMPAYAARELINEVLEDEYFWQFPSWSTAKINNNGLFFTDICWGNINGTIYPSWSEGKCVDVYSCNTGFYGHDNCFIDPEPATDCMSIAEINVQFNAAKNQASLNKPSITHEVAFCQLYQGQPNTAVNDIYFYDRVYYGIPTSVAQIPMMSNIL